MASNHNRLSRDLIGKTLSIGNKIVIDKNRNLEVKNARVIGDLYVDGSIIGGCSSNCDTNGDAVCPLLPQPPTGTPTPLTGENCISCYESEPLNVACRDLNANKVCYNYTEMCDDLNAPLVYPGIVNPSKLVLTPNPAYVVPLGQKACQPAPLPMSPLSLTGKHVLVVGASKGIGKACAERFVTEGADVIGTSRHPLCYPPGDYSYPLKTLDVRETKNVKRFILDLMGNTWTNGQIDILVLCPAIHFIGQLAECTGDELTDAFDAMVSGYQRVVHYALPYMRHSDDTRVISLGSTAGEGGVILDAYSISKRALQFWNDMHQQESMMRKARGQVTYEPTFSLIEPGFILTSISMYEFYKPAGVSETNADVRGEKFSINFLQNVAAPNPVTVVSETVYRVAVAPQPGVRYISDNDTPIPFLPGTPTMTQLTQSYNTLSADDAVNQLSMPFLEFIVTNAVPLQAAVASAYCPP